MKFELQGHLAARAKSIQSPVFASGGKRVVATGERSALVTLYDCAGSGEVVSRGEMDFCPTKLCCVEGEGHDFVVAAGHGDLCLLRPQ